MLQDVMDSTEFAGIGPSALPEVIVTPSEDSGALFAHTPDDVFQDHLTGVANRRYYERRLDDALRASKAAGEITTVLLLDLDRFKAVNDSLGHAVGDALLRLVSQRMMSVLRDGDTLARMGGDEFGIILGPASDASQLAARLVDLVQRTYLVEGCPVNIGVSIGIATGPKDGGERSGLLKSADLALYQAKAIGRSCFVFFEPEMHARAQVRRSTELELRKALALRQFELHYRPQIDVLTTSLQGLEAVLQWRHPTRGLLPPSAFIPLAEEIGMILPIGEWVLKAVCREASRWPHDVTVSASVSPLQFESERFIAAMKQALDATGVPGNRLELTVTESILLRDGRSVLHALNSLRSMGVKVAIDSFGTGIASLSQMVDFPLDKIKIARSLVEEGGTGARERAIVRAIAALGASLGISTLVEGVSTREHLARIQMDGCSSVQGYLESHVVPASELRVLVDNLLFPTNRIP